MTGFSAMYVSICVLTAASSYEPAWATASAFFPSASGDDWMATVRLLMTDSTNEPPSFAWALVTETDALRPAPRPRDAAGSQLSGTNRLMIHRDRHRGVTIYGKCAGVCFFVSRQGGRTFSKLVWNQDFVPPTSAGQIAFTPRGS
jgi:hypothetical protein